jgi:hypothetical protein
MTTHLTDNSKTPRKVIAVLLPVLAPFAFHFQIMIGLAPVFDSLDALAIITVLSSLS